MKISGLVGGIVACFITVVLAVVLAFVFAPEGSDVTSLTTALLGTLAPTVAVLATLGKVREVDAKVDYLANGGTDAKIRAGIADVVRPDLLKPDSGEQIAADRAHRAAGPSKH